MKAIFRKFGRNIALWVVFGAILCACDSQSASTTDSMPHTTSDKASGAPAKAKRAAIVETLTDRSAADDARLESIHRARDLGVTDAVPALRSLLHSDNPNIVVAAAAALDGLNATGADLALIEAAGQLGRARQFEHLRQLLYLLGSVGGPRAKTYLETIAEGHELAPIRNTAAQILNDSFPKE